MDSNFLVNSLNEFDELRISRIAQAQEFLDKYKSDEELFADLANILALLYAATKFRQISQGFKSDSR